MSGAPPPTPLRSAPPPAVAAPAPATTTDPAASEAQLLAAWEEQFVRGLCRQVMQLQELEGALLAALCDRAYVQAHLPSENAYTYELLTARHDRLAALLYRATQHRADVGGPTGD